MAYLSNPLDYTFGFLRAEDLTFNAAADMPAGYANRPYTACFENGIITIDTSKRYTKDLDQARCGTKGVKIGSPPNASGRQHFPRNWHYSCWNNVNSARSGYVVALHRVQIPAGKGGVRVGSTANIAPEYSSSNDGYSESAIYAIMEIPNASDGTLPTTQERNSFMSSIGSALSDDNVNFGTVTSTCGVLPAGETTDPACTTDTYWGGYSNEDCGGYDNNPDDKKSCASYSDSTLVAGDTYKLKNRWVGGYSVQTVPANTIVCTYDQHDMPNRSNQWREEHPRVDCNVDQDKVLGPAIMGDTSGVWECIPKLGCKDLHNTNYAPETQRTHSSSVCAAGTCISGASKKLLGSGDGSCIKSLQNWVLIKSETGCCTQTGYSDCKCRYQVAIGKSGWGDYILSYRNFQGPSGTTCVAGTCDQWKSGRGGMARFPTLAAAQAAFNTMKAGAIAAVNGTDTDTDTETITCGDNEELDATSNTCGCKSGYVADTTGTCVAVDADECSTTADCAECEKCETDADNVARCITDPDCTPGVDDPNGCLPLYKTVGSDGTCGDCKTGYTENDDGECIEDEDEEEEETGLSPLVIGGMVAGAALLALMVVKK